MKPYVVVGAGLAGLSCACHLKRSDKPVLVLEASDGPGGRARTDIVYGFCLDRGFHVFQTAYPEAKELLDYEKLQLVELEPGAVIRKNKKWHRMSDPIRRPTQAFATLFNAIGNLQDRFRLLALRRKCMKGSALNSGTEDISTEQFLKSECGFSNSFIDGFLRPWLAGIFFEDQLETSSNYFRFVFRNLASGPIAYPKLGIQAIADQLARSIGRNSIRYDSRVEQVSASQVTLASGEVIEAAGVCLATNAEVAGKLMGREEKYSAGWNATCCLYFECVAPPTKEKCLMLNGDGEGPVNNAMVLTNTIPELAPRDKTLVSVSLTCEIANEWKDDDPLALQQVRRQLGTWFEEDASDWKFLKSYVIPEALPRQLPGFYSRREGFEIVDEIRLCGQEVGTSSVEGVFGAVVWPLNPSLWIRIPRDEWQYVQPTETFG